MIQLPYLPRRGGLYPIVPLTLKNNDKNVKIDALVDSGANISLFHASYAQYLGIDLEKGQRTYLEGIGGRILGFAHTVDIEVLGKAFNLKVIFSRELVTTFNILGRDNFFLEFVISFDEKNKILKLE